MPVPDPVMRMVLVQGFGSAELRSLIVMAILVRVVGAAIAGVIAACLLGGRMVVLVRPACRTQHSSPGPEHPEAAVPMTFMAPVKPIAPDAAILWTERGCPRMAERLPPWLGVGL